MTSRTARYDGHAEWYDQTFSASLVEDEVSFLREGLGQGNGQVCLDVACGTGRYGRVLADAGYRAVGFDISADQLRFARRRLGAVVRSDAVYLPVRDASWRRRPGCSSYRHREFSASGHVILPWDIAVMAGKGR